MKKPSGRRGIALLVVFCSILLFSQPVFAAIKIFEEAGVDSLAAQDIRFAAAAINPHLVWDFCTSLHIAAHAWILAGARAIWRKNFSARSLRKNERPWTFKGCLSSIEGHLKKSFKPASILVQTI